MCFFDKGGIKLTSLKMWDFVQMAQQAKLHYETIRVMVEVFLVFFALKYLASKRYDPEQRINFSPRETDELVDEWEPEPLAFDDEIKVPVFENWENELVKLEGIDQPVLNLLSMDVYMFSIHDRIKKKAIEGLRIYGVGSCGPPGFYGYMDVHEELEKNLCEFMGTESSILYAQGFSAVSSVIPAFAKRGDVLVVDNGVSFQVQKGVQISRSHVLYFNHNDLTDLEEKLSVKSKNRKFVVVEGLYSKFGDLCPLPEIIELCRKFKFRLIMDDSNGIGVLGATGRGTCEHFQVDPKKVDILIGQLSTTFAAAGGFCLGSKAVVDHQRLSASAYCFSASMPPLLAMVAMESLSLLKPELIQKLKNLVLLFRETMNLPHIELISSVYSPIQHIYVHSRSDSKCEISSHESFPKIVDKCLEKGILVGWAKYSEQEIFIPRQSIKIVLNINSNKRHFEDIRACFE